ncbi:MAG TPA: arsenate reductase ArsC [Rhodocyclaceae bacterium]|nr:arsenate reductase ArsC [Rhodocyclaceae bacterium]
MKTFNVLFLCTGNSARSIMAEALLHTLGQGHFNVFSAGSHPTGHVNPFAIEKVGSLGYPLEKLRSKSWDEFAVAGAPTMDFVITVCDQAGGEVCPIWPGQPISAHWGFRDPAAIQGSDEEKRGAFDAVFHQIECRARAFAALPLATLDRQAIQQELRAIGERPAKAQS